jgi:hypothetical protein
MPSLVDTIKQNGQLGQTSQEELNSLAGAAGRPAVPTSPLESGVIGANPDQAKMAGTDANKLNAIRQSIQESNQLATSQRQAQARKTANASEQQGQELAKKQQGLGSLQGRVQELADKLFSGQGQQFAKEQTVDVNKLTAAIPNANDLPEAQALLTKVGQNTATPQEIVRAGQIFGITDVKDISALQDQLKNNFLGMSEQAGAAAAAAIPDTMTMKDLNAQQLQALGYNSLDEMALDLGTTAQALQDTTVGNLKATIGAERRDKFSKVDQMRNILGDPNRSPAEKDQAMKVLRELGAVGTGAAEQQMANLQTQVEKGNTVDFFGKKYTTEELLNNDFISGMVKNYFDDPNIAKQLRDQEPEFASWIENNKQVLTEAAQNVDKEVADFSAKQTANMAIADTEGGHLSDDTMKAVFDDWGTIRADSYQPPELINVLNDKAVPVNFQANMAAGLNQLAVTDPNTIKAIQDTTKQDLYNADMVADPSAVGRYINYVQQARQLNNAPPEAALQTVMPDVSDDEVQSIMKMGNILNNSGLADAIDPQIRHLIDADGDGSVDSPEAVKGRLVDLLTAGKGTPATIKDMAGGQVGFTAANIPSVQKMFQQYQNQVSQATNSGLFGMMKDALADGKLDYKDAHTLYERTGNTVDDFNNMQQFADKQKLGDADFNGEVNNLLQRKASDVILNNLPGDWNDKKLSAFNNAADHLDSTDMDDLASLAKSLKDMAQDPQYRDSRLQSEIEDRARSVTDILTTNIKAMADKAASEADDRERQREAQVIDQNSSILQHLVPGSWIGDIQDSVNNYLQNKLGTSDTQKIVQFSDSLNKSKMIGKTQAQTIQKVSKALGRR